ncbi:hypothetical protein HYH02_010423 [Chlamydomonas schloesseri]|uniref:C2 domain-containing protein n=1 Tax=Chlamydomonas schloesseri TaxID=2026947 RepID=A0A835TAY3_9CHLO|nr:hypothetical protein HYH02_010423 [Chlamydomonas schloesseri]|eukprot:KAG2439788.1 hypothetical protein HYH02_010423 [Chlamydomonas schloesseri]
MADNIKVINAGDLLSGVKLTFAPASAQAAAHSSARHADVGTTGASGAAGPTSPSGSPLEDVAASLAEQYAASDWLVPPGQPNDWRFMIPVCRAVLLGWYNPAETLPARLRLAEALGRAFGLDEDAVEQMVAESLLLNTAVATQLALQQLALAGGCFAVREADFPDDRAARAAYQTFRRDATSETEQLLRQQLGLPDFNGLLYVTVLGGEGLRAKGRSGKALHPYVSVWLADGKSGSRRGEKQLSDVAADTDVPTWDKALSPWAVTQPDMELVLQVRTATERGKPSRSDTLLGKAGVRLGGLVPGLTQRVTLPIYGHKGDFITPRGAKGGGGLGPSGARGAKKGGGGFLCGCFGGGGGAAAEAEAEAAAARAAAEAEAAAAAAAVAGRQGSVEQLDDEAGGRVVFDPASAQISGNQEREERGRVTLLLRYLPELRERPRGALAPSGSLAAVGGGGSSSRHTRAPSIGRTDRLPSMPRGSVSTPDAGHSLTPMASPRRAQASEAASAVAASAAAAAAASAVAAAASGNPAATAERLGSSLDEVSALLAQMLKQLHSSLPPGVRLVRRLDSRPLDPCVLLDPAADFHATFRKLAAALQALARQGGGQLAKVPDPGIPLTALGPLGASLEDAGLEAPLTAFLSGGSSGLGPLPGHCLALLLLFAKLHRVRPATQHLALLLALLGGSGGWRPSSRAYLALVKQLWQQALMWNRSGGLTLCEAEGLNGVMAAFLQRAVPLLADHYNQLQGEVEQVVPCLVLLVEMTGWALTWDPTRPPPYRPLAEHLVRAAGARAAATAASLRPTHETLPSDVAAVAAAAEQQAADLERDLALQAAVPGLRGLAAVAARRRYDVLSDCLETLFMYRPGSTGAASAALPLLEERVTALHVLLLRNRLAAAPQKSSSAGTQQPISIGTPGSRKLLTIRTSGNGAAPGADPGDDSDVSPMSLSPSSAVASAAEAAQRAAGRKPAATLPAGKGGKKPAGRSARLQIPGVGGGKAVSAAAKCVASAAAKQSGDTDEEDDSDPEGVDDALAEGLLLSGGGADQLHLFDLEAAMTEALAQWAETGGEDLKRQLLRLLERDPLWPPPAAAEGAGAAAGGGGAGGPGGAGGVPPTGKSVLTPAGAGAAKASKAGKALAASGAGTSALELFRILEAYVDVSLERALGGGEQRPGRMGPVITSAAVAVVRSYLHHVMSAWEEILACRALPADSGAAPAGHRHARTISDRFLHPPGGAPGGPPMGQLLSGPALTAAAGFSQVPSLAAPGANGALGAGLPAPTLSVPQFGVLGGAGPSGQVGLGAPGGAAGGIGPSPLKARGGHHRRAATTTDNDLFSAGVFASAGHVAATAAGTGKPGQAGAAAPVAGAAGASAAALPPAVLLALAAEPGLVACDALVTVRNTLAAVAEQVEGLQGSLAVLGPRQALLSTQTHTPGSAAPLGRPAAPPAYISRANADLDHALSAATRHCIASYRAAIRPGIMCSLTAAFDRKGAAPPSTKALESLLTKLHDELVCLADGLRRASVAGGLMLGAWQAAVGCVSALALHQVPGWRPLTEAEADVLRDFLISLQDMFGEVVDEYLAPRARREAAERGQAGQAQQQQQQRAGGSARGGDKAGGIIPAELADADARAAGTAYTSSLLQCVAAATEDLCDMYNAQVSCLQQVDDTVDEDVGPLRHQVTLLDILRMLRQRRRSDPAAQTFVTEKLRLAASSAAQVVFGLRASERLVASTACSLLAPPVGPTGAPAAAAAPLALVSSAVPGATNSSSSSAAAASAVASRDGLLYLTPRVLGYSTLLAGDLRGGADITFKLRLKDVKDVLRGDGADSLVITTTEGDVYQFGGFAPTERERVWGLLHGAPAVGPTLTPGTSAALGSVSTPPALAAIGVGIRAAAGSGQPSPRISGNGMTPGGAAASGTPTARAMDTETPKSHGLPKPPRAVMPSASVGRNARAAHAAAADAVASASTAAAAGAVAPTLSAPGPAALPSLLSGAAAKAMAALLPGAAATHGGAATDSVEAPAAAGGGITGGGPSAGTSSLKGPVERGALPLLSTPCHLVNVLRNKDGMLHLYAGRLDFVCTADPPLSRSLPLSAINNVSQRPGGWGGGSVLVLTVEGEKASLVFGGMGDALLATLKQNVSELCFANG